MVQVDLSAAGDTALRCFSIVAFAVSAFSCVRPVITRVSVSAAASFLNTRVSKQIIIARSTMLSASRRGVQRVDSFRLL